MAQENNSYVPLQQDPPLPEEVEDGGDVTDETKSQSDSVRRRRLMISILSHLLCVICGVLVGFLLHMELSLSSVKSDRQGPLAGPETGAASSASLTSSTPSLATTKVIDGVLFEGTQCGNNWEEARALGCHFDVMASRWYSPECFDKEALDEMLQEPRINYTWFADQEHTVSLHPDVALAGEFDKIYPAGDFHIGHCLYLWRRLHRAVLHNRPLDDDLFNYGHTVHCTRLILKWKDPWETVTYQTSGRPFCRHNRLGYIDSLSS